MKIEDLISRIQNDYQIRFSNNQKEEFRMYIKDNLENKYNIKINESLNTGKVKNLHTDIDNCDVIFTAHYDTPANTPPELMMFSDFIKTSSKCTKLVLLILLSIVGFLIYKIPITYPLLVIIVIIWLCIRGKVILNANKNNYNDNTSGVISLLYLIDKFKDNKNIGFIFFDCEERRFKGSKKFYKKHKKMIKDKIFINLDCVGGTNDCLIISPRNKKWENDKRYKEIINGLKTELKNKEIYVIPRHSKSDYLKIKHGVSVGISNEKQYKYGYYIPDIHTDKDDKIDQEFIKRFTDELYNSVNNYLHFKYSQNINSNK